MSNEDLVKRLLDRARHHHVFGYTSDGRAIHGSEDHAEDYKLLTAAADALSRPPVEGELVERVAQRLRQFFSDTIGLEDDNDLFARATAAIIPLVLEEAAKVADDFDWILPLHEGVEANEASDDAAEMVKEQIAAAIRSLGRPA